MGTNGKEIFEMVPVDEELISPQELLTIIEEKNSEIESIKFQPPDIDSDDFGQFKIQWRSPRYRNVKDV